MTDITLLPDTLCFRRDDGSVYLELDVIDAELKLEQFESEHEDMRGVVDEIKTWLSNDDREVTSTQAWTIYHAVRAEYVEFKKKADAMLGLLPSTESTPGCGTSERWGFLKSIFHPSKQNGSYSAADATGT